MDRTYAFAYVLTDNCSTDGVFNASKEALASHPRQALLIPLPIAVFFGGALVVLLLTFGHTDLHFGAAALSETWALAQDEPEARHRAASMPRLPGVSMSSRRWISLIGPTT